MSTIVPTEYVPQTVASKKDRYVLTQVGSWVLVFSNRWILEIFRVQRSRILDLPFYPSLVMGVTHHRSQILPLVSAHQMLQAEEGTMLHDTSSTILHLNIQANSLGNVGIVVDKVLGSRNLDQLPPSLLTMKALHPQNTNSMVLFQPDWLPADLWHPLT